MSKNWKLAIAAIGAVLALWMAWDSYWSIESRRRESERQTEEMKENIGIDLEDFGKD